jgi:hypothetical protein
MWSRKDIYFFFSDHSCSKADLKLIDNFKERQLTRSGMVDTMFEHLSLKTDGGLGPFRAMLHSLVNWSRFDPYYFDTLKKLDRSEAQKNLAHLRQLQEIRDAKIEQERERRAAAEVLHQRPEFSLEELRNQFLTLHSEKTDIQKRGYAFEKILIGLSKLSELEVTEPFRIYGEQIDGAVKFEGEHYLIEAKWQDKSASNEPVYQFVGKVEGKMYGRGMFVSIQGFSEHLVQNLTLGKAIKTILVDGEDMVLVLEGQLTFRQMIDKKVKADQTRGLIYVNPITGIKKI